MRHRRDSIGLRAPWDLTVGTSSFPGDGETVDALLHAADHRLYEQRGIELRDGGGREIPARTADRRVVDPRTPSRWPEFP